MADYKSREFWFPWALAILVLSALVFSEWRAINYDLFGSRSASPIDFFILSGGIFYLVIMTKKYGVSYLLRQIFSLCYFLLPIALMIFLYNDRSALSNIAPSFTRYLLVGLVAYMLFSCLMLSKCPVKKILAYLMHYIFITSFFILLVYAITRFYPFKIFMYGEATPALNFPFGSPNQAALFVVLNFFLGIGVVLALRKFYFLYFFVPVMVLAVFQTGSRSMAILLVAGGVAFILLILFQWIYSKKCPWRELINLLISLVLAAFMLFLTLDAQKERAISIFNSSFSNVVSGKIDPYRYSINKRWKWSDVLVVEPKVELREGAHNAYLDLLLNWGKLSFISFIVFLLVLLFSLMSLLWHKRISTNYPLYSALLIGVGVIIGAIFVNPLLHLKFIWIFFGVSISFLLNKYSNYNHIGSRIIV